MNLINIAEKSVHLNASSSLDFIINSKDCNYLISPNYAAANFNLIHNVTENKVTSDGVKSIAYLTKDSGATIAGTQCIFKLYQASLTDYSETVLATATVSPSADGKFRKDFTIAEMSGFDPIGEYVLMLHTRIDRWDGKKFKREYFDNVGTFGFTESILRRVRILETE